MVPFFRGGWEGGGGSYSSKILFSLADILARGSFPTREAQCLKNPSKF